MNTSRVTMPNGTCMTIEGGDAQDVANVLNNKLGQNPAKLTANAAKPIAAPSLLVPIPPKGATLMVGDDGSQCFVKNGVITKIPTPITLADGSRCVVADGVATRVLTAGAETEQTEQTEQTEEALTMPVINFGKAPVTRLIAAEEPSEEEDDEEPLAMPSMG